MPPAPPPGPFLRFSLCPPGHEYAGKKRRECNTFLGPDELSGPGALRSRKWRKAKGRIENKEVRSQKSGIYRRDAEARRKRHLWHEIDGKYKNGVAAAGALGLVA